MKYSQLLLGIAIISHTLQEKRISSYSATSPDKEELEVKEKQQSDFYISRRKMAANKQRIFIQLLFTVLSTHVIFKWFCFCDSPITDDILQNLRTKFWQSKGPAHPLQEHPAGGVLAGIEGRSKQKAAFPWQTLTAIR